jgi:phage shock protein PspC (stress-responsive transcriptional regulator)
MKKTISINISGVIFNIEEDAYERLKQYLDTISGYFTDSDGKQEIMADIEARIAELFQAKLHDGKNVVSMQDVEEVMDVMGRPEEYLDEEGAAATASHDRKKGRSRRVYRDVDKNLIGGVCAGIAHYFGWDPLWIRLAWGISIFVFGVGIIPYIILWIIIPGATTTTEKLEMMGEPVTVESIKKKVTETYDDFKAKSEAKGLDTDFQLEHAKRQVNRGGSFLVDVIKKLFRFLGSLLGFVFLFSGLALMTFILYNYFDNSLLQLDGRSWEWGFEELQRGLFTSSLHSYMFILGAALFILIPLIGLVMLGSKLLFRYQTNNKFIFPVMFTLWLIGLVSITIAGIGLGKEFANEEDYSESEKLTLQGDILYLDVVDDTYFSNAIRNRHDRFLGELLELKEDTMYCGYPELRIRQQLGKPYSEVEIVKESHGYTSESAFDRAGSIVYEYKMTGDTILFDPHFRYALDDKMRSQGCDIILKIPVGQQVYLGKKIPRVLEYARNRHGVGVEDMTDKLWIMTDEGLKSVHDLEEEPVKEREDALLDEDRAVAVAPAPPQLKFVPSNPLFALDVRYGDSERRK